MVTLILFSFHFNLPQLTSGTDFWSVGDQLLLSSADTQISNIYLAYISSGLLNVVREVGFPNQEYGILSLPLFLCSVEVASWWVPVLGEEWGLSRHEPCPLQVLLWHLAANTPPSLFCKAVLALLGLAGPGMSHFLHISSACYNLELVDPCAY